MPPKPKPGSPGRPLNIAIPEPPAAAGSPIRKATDAEASAASDFSTPPRASGSVRTSASVRSPSNGCVTPTASSTPPIAALRAMSFSSPTPLTPLPIAIDMPSPGSFDPLLEHFLQPLEPEAGMCRCTFERPRAGGRGALRMCAEEGNVPLLSAERAGRTVWISGSDGTRFASMHAEAGGHALRSVNAPPAAPEVAAFLLGERELDVPASMQRPRVNWMLVATPRVEDSGLAAPPNVKALGRPPGELLGALRQLAAAPELPTRPLQDLQLWQSRLPVWDAERELLTLDFPPGRATLASVQNFQLVDAIPPEGGGDDDDAAAAPPTPTSAASDEGPEPLLVHGQTAEGDAHETFSLDFSAPLSPLLALAACIAAQDWV